VNRILIIFLVALPACAAVAAMAEKIPLPRPRPATADANPETAPPAEPSACRLRLTDVIAIAPSLPPINDPGGCSIADVVKLEAIFLKDGGRVTVAPPATLACTMAEAIVQWVREDVAPMVRAEFGSQLRSVDNYDSFSCRGRNNIPGAKLSEHGRANALDIRSVKLADGRLVKLTDPYAPLKFRENVKQSVCREFSTVLGPGSDGHHEDHVHEDLLDRAPRHFRMCQWDVREPEPEVEAKVPLPRPRPDIEHKVTAGKRP
jgi:hypothetical protein